MEVKPVLHIPENGDDEVGNTLPHLASREVLWDFQDVECSSPCYQIYSVSGKICIALVSVTKDLATKICSKAELGLDFDNHMRVIVKFMIFIINNILLDNCFLWSSLMVSSSIGMKLSSVYLSYMIT